MYKYLGKKIKDACIILLFWLNRCQLQDTATVNSKGPACGRTEGTTFDYNI